MPANVTARYLASRRGVGFRPPEMARLSSCLSRLGPSLLANDVAVTGGVAIQIGMAELGHAGPRDTVADLDLVASSLDAIPARVADTFLVSHYHVAQRGVPKFLVQLVDPETRIRVDVFPDLVDSLARSKVIQIGQQCLRMLALEDILEHKLLTVSKASPGNPVDPKHADDARALGELLQRPVPTLDPASLAADVHGGKEDLYCRRCELSSSVRFPLAPKDQIFSLLGWT